MITPAELIELMVRIARRVAQGALQGVLMGYGEGGEKIPCQWISSDEDGMSDADEDVWSEDDYGVPLGRINRDALRRRDVARSWHAM